jgi:UDP-N-acetylmuramyl pentapeptide synthase
VTVCKSLTNAETVFLIKGSRGARMEFVVNELISDEES